MSEDTWVRAQHLLNEWPEVKPDILDKGVLRRLGDALAGLQSGASGWLDIASLTRQLLLVHQALGRTGHLSVPLRAGLPTADQWRQGGCNVLVDGSRVLLRGQEWAPVEGDEPAHEAGLAQVREAVLGKDSTLRRVLEAAPADPFWKDVLGYDHYLSKGQRQAARSVVLMPPGETLLICLPTGHGKTPVALAGAMLAGRNSGVSLMVVPTVVLAIDMERRVRELLSRRDPGALHNRYAYFGELDQADKEQMRADISAGRQALVIASRSCGRRTQHSPSRCRPRRSPELRHTGRSTSRRTVGQRVPLGVSEPGCPTPGLARDRSQGSCAQDSCNECHAHRTTGDDATGSVRFR